MNNPRAFILEHPCNIDVSKAKRFGDIEFVFGPNDRRSSIWSKRFITEIKDMLKRKKFDPDKDFIIAVGHLVPLVIMFSDLVLHYDHLNVLLYSSVDSDYVVRTLGKGNHHVARAS